MIWDQVWSILGSRDGNMVNGCVWEAFDYYVVAHQQPRSHKTHRCFRAQQIRLPYLLDLGEHHGTNGGQIRHNGSSWGIWVPLPWRTVVPIYLRGLAWRILLLLLFTMGEWFWYYPKGTLLIAAHRISKTKGREKKKKSKYIKTTCMHLLSLPSGADTWSVISVQPPLSLR